MAEKIQPMVLIHNVETDEIEQIPMDADEIKRLAGIAASIEDAKLKQEQAKQSAFEKLSALGLTEEEIKALAG